MYLSGIRHYSLSAIFILGLIILTSIGTHAQKTYNRPIDGKAALIQKQRAAQQQQQLLRAKQIQQQQYAQRQQLLRAKQLQQQQYAQQQQLLRAKQIQQQQIAQQQQLLRARQIQKKQYAQQQQLLRAKQLQQQQYAQQQLLRAKQIQQQQYAQQQQLLRAKQIQQQQYAQQQQVLRAKRLQQQQYAQQQQVLRAKQIQQQQYAQQQQLHRAKQIQQQQIAQQQQLLRSQQIRQQESQQRQLANQRRTYRNSAIDWCQGKWAPWLCAGTPTTPAATTSTTTIPTDLWAAFAFSPLTGENSHAVNYPTQADAERAAKDVCGWDCVIVGSFANQCGALAIGELGAASGVGANPNIAQQDALDRCAVFGFCEIVQSICTGPQPSLRSGQPRSRAARGPTRKPVKKR